MAEPKDRIILPLDVDNADEALRLTHLLRNSVGVFKVGLELVNSAGFDIFSRLQDAGANRIFYDAKFHDIPNTVAGAMKSVGRRGVWMVNVHTCGGSRMVRAAADALAESASSAGYPAPILLGVTLLTSITQEELESELHVGLDTQGFVGHLAALAKSAGANGVVASPHEIETIRATCGKGFLVVTPGVRPAGAQANDQRRTMTPAQAIRHGADYLVVGRPITAAPDPVAAAAAIAEEMETAL